MQISEICIFSKHFQIRPESQKAHSRIYELKINFPCQGAGVGESKRMEGWRFSVEREEGERDIYVTRNSSRDIKLDFNAIRLSVARLK